MKFRVIIETRDGYEKVVEAESFEAARAQVEAEDGWGSHDHGWERTDDCYSAIERVESVEARGQGDDN